MRAYRVHELLTRHAQGKQRGQVDHDRVSGEPQDQHGGPPVGADAEASVADAFGHVQEDGT